jgi:membrane fusion protein (multidrug efflux system)
VFIMTDHKRSDEPTDATPTKGVASDEQNKPATDGQERAPAKPKGDPKKRRKLMIGLAVVLVLVAIGWGVYALFFAGRSVSTDNAYTNVEVADVTPQIAAAVKDVKVVDTQAVKAGDVLVVLDDTDAKIAVARAEASLSQARRKVQGTIAQDSNLGGQEDLRAAEITAAQADVARLKADYDKAAIDQKRRKNLVEDGAVSRQEVTDADAQVAATSAMLQQAQARVTVAVAARSAAGGARQANAVLFAETTVDTNPEVLSAKAELDQATIDLSRTIIRAPVTGVVTQRAVDIGQQVQPGRKLMSVVPVERMYVDANFKEGQLRKVKEGQEATVTADIYGSDVVYHGYVEGFAGGTGSAFSAIPAQNATGNWIKVVQRLPVRVRLDAKDIRDHPLRVGLSMVVEVDLTSDPNARKRARERSGVSEPSDTVAEE